MHMLIDHLYNNAGFLYIPKNFNCGIIETSTIWPCFLKNVPSQLIGTRKPLRLFEKHTGRQSRIDMSGVPFALSLNAQSLHHFQKLASSLLQICLICPTDSSSKWWTEA